MNEFLIGAIGAVGIPLALWLIGIALPREKTHKWGYNVGRFVTVFLRQKLGKQGEKIENRMQTTVADFMDGVYEGLDSDDK